MSNFPYFVRKTITAVLVTAQISICSLPVKTQEISEVDLHSLCSRFPLNSRCEGYEAPVSLQQRQGSPAACILNELEEANYSGDCKVSFTQDTLTIYLEEGDKLSILDNQRTTKKIEFNLSDIEGLTYQDYEQHNVGQLIGTTLLFGVWGLLRHRADKYSRLDISFAEQEESLLTVVSSRDIGIPLRSRLEQLTGVFAVTPETELVTETEVEVQPTVNNPPPPEDLQKFCQSFPHNSRCQE